ncbi:MAG: hypothetical protein ACO32I_04405, partial [Candidatus Limnocylindrus sp.]
MGSELISQVHSANSGYLHAKSDLLYYGLARIAYYAEIEPLIHKLDKLFSADTSLGVNSEFPYIPPEYDTLLSIGIKLAAIDTALTAVDAAIDDLTAQVNETTAEGCCADLLISDISDISVIEPSNGDALVYDADTGVWKNSPVSATQGHEHFGIPIGIPELDLSDVPDGQVVVTSKDPDLPLIGSIVAPLNFTQIRTTLTEQDVSGARDIVDNTQYVLSEPATLTWVAVAQDLARFGVDATNAAAVVSLPEGSVFEFIAGQSSVPPDVGSWSPELAQTDGGNYTIAQGAIAYFWYISPERSSAHSGWYFSRSNVNPQARFPYDQFIRDSYIAPIFPENVILPPYLHDTISVDIGASSRVFRDIYLRGSAFIGPANSRQEVGLRRAVEILDVANLQLAQSPLPAESLVLSVNGCVQAPGDDYTVDTDGAVTWTGDFELA